MLPIPFAVAACVEVVLILAESSWPDVLPLGGSHVSQLGFLFGGAAVACEAFLLGKRITAKFRAKDKGSKF